MRRSVISALLAAPFLTALALISLSPIPASATAAPQAPENRNNIRVTVPEAVKFGDQIYVNPRHALQLRTLIRYQRDVPGLCCHALQGYTQAKPADIVALALRAFIAPF